MTPFLTSTEIDGNWWDTKLLFQENKKLNFNNQTK